MTKVADWLVSLGVETEDVDWSIDKFGPEIAQCQSMKESSLNVESQTVGPSTSSWKPWRTWEFRNGVKMKTTMHCGTKPGRYETSNHTLSHQLGSEQANERMSAAERASETSSVKQAD